MKTLKTKLFFLAFFIAGFFLFGFASAQACDIYVSTTGADNSSCGILSNPCRHIEYAVEQRAVNGQTVCVNDGT
ncbi:MAG: hypothetical protein U9N04_03855, partial [Patescibacteria group bacterium]|nr:hypothetical protein [Patescibacteria group bacterium]